MSASAPEVARPTLRGRGLLGWAEPILIAGERAVDHHAEVFVGIDVAKPRNAIAIADGERGGEVRFLGEVDTSPGVMRAFRSLCYHDVLERDLAIMHDEIISSRYLLRRSSKLDPVEDRHLVAQDLYAGFHAADAGYVLPAGE